MCIAEKNQEERKQSDAFSLDASGYDREKKRTKGLCFSDHVQGLPVERQLNHQASAIFIAFSSWCPRLLPIVLLFKVRLAIIEENPHFLTLCCFLQFLKLGFLSPSTTAARR